MPEGPITKAIEAISERLDIAFAEALAMAGDVSGMVAVGMCPEEIADMIICGEDV